MRFYRGLLLGCFAAVVFWAVATVLVVLTVNLFS